MRPLRKIPRPAVFVSHPGLLRRFVTCVGLAGLIAVSGAARVQSAPLTLQYLVGWGHMTLAEAEISYASAENLYFLKSAGRTLGLLEFFFPWQGQAETKGLLENGDRRPLRHTHEGTLDENTRWTQVDWDKAGRPRTEAVPRSDPQVVTEVPESSLAGTWDPFTAVLSLLDHLTRSGRCEGTARIWDGRRRYDIVVTHLGEEDLVADRPWSYDGPAVRCAMDFHRIGGFRRETPGGLTQDEDDAGQRTIWVAEIDPGQWVLVRAELETPYGTVVGRLRPGNNLTAALDRAGSRGAQ